MAEELIRPTVENLRAFGAEPLTRWLIGAAKDRRTVTYGEAKRRLEEGYRFSTIFSPMMGQPAGRAMDAILQVDPRAPLLNVLLVQQVDGMPSTGAGRYMADYFGNDRLRHKDARTNLPVEWRQFFERAAADVYSYSDWEDLYERVYGRQYQPDGGTIDQQAATGGSEKDGLPRGRSGEGPNHKALRLWVKANPWKLFKNINLIEARTEVDLLSGDRVDVIYYATDRTVAIEVKARDSNDADLLRGIYQCVKYRAVLKVMDARSNAPVDTVLVTELPLPGYLNDLARRLRVKHTSVPIDR